MIEKQTDLWTEPADARCITTNGFVKMNGELVMGRGVALQAKLRYPSLPTYWGHRVKSFGNHLATYREDQMDFTLVSFPVKHNWYEKADLALIKQSAEELQKYINIFNRDFQKILLPRPGCGNGGLDWKDVKPVIEPILDDRIIVISQ